MRGVALLAVLMPLFAFGGSSDESVRDRMLRDVDFIHNTFQVRYAPAEWKKRYADWDLATEIDKVRQDLLQLDDLSIKGFQRSLRKFFQSTKDYHVGVNFWSTEWSTLPFNVCGANGKYFITYIDRDRLPARSFPFAVGDELVLFDGRLTGDVIKQLREEEVGNASPDTDQALAELFLTRRMASQGLLVPRGPVTISVRNAKTGGTSSYQIIWNYNPEKIRELPLSSLSVDSAKKSKDVWNSPIFHKRMTSPLIDALKPLMTACPAGCDPNQMGGRQSFIPVLGKVLWQGDPSSPFYAYIFKTTSGKKVGYVRIPSYDGGAMEVKEFADIIAYLEHHSEALVIDQVNNPGGSVFYLYGLASLLTDQPLLTPKHRMTITQEEVAYAHAYVELLAQVRNDDDARYVLGESLEGYPINYQTTQFMLHYFRFIIDEWNAGRTLTKPYYLYGVDCINHHPEVRYTKPILLLVNRLCFSGGDFLPAILQDNKRVTVFGSRTAGAGGYVDSCMYSNPFGVAQICYTASIAERIDNHPIENLGVTPDIIYDLTEEDLQNNFKGYVERVLQAVEHLR